MLKFKRSGLSILALAVALSACGPAEVQLSRGGRASQVSTLGGASPTSTAPLQGHWKSDIVAASFGTTRCSQMVVSIQGSSLKAQSELHSTDGCADASPKVAGARTYTITAYDSNTGAFLVKDNSGGSSSEIYFIGEGAITFQGVAYYQ